MEGVFVFYVFHQPTLHQVDICHCVASHISHTRHSILLFLAALCSRHCQVWDTEKEWKTQKRHTSFSHFVLVSPLQFFCLKNVFCSLCNSNSNLCGPSSSRQEEADFLYKSWHFWTACRNMATTYLWIRKYTFKVIRIQCTVFFKGKSSSCFVHISQHL